MFTITLTEHKCSKTFTRENFLSVFPNSMISNALELTSDVNIDITQPFVIPEVLDILHLMCEEGEMNYQSNDAIRANVDKSANYLGIDLLAVVNDPKFQELSWWQGGLNLSSREWVLANSKGLLRHACSTGDMPLLRHIISQGVDPSTNPDIMSSRHPEVMTFLLADPRVDPSVNKNRALESAIDRDDLEMVKRLMAHPRITSPDGFFWQAFSAGTRFHMEIFKFLLADPRVDMSQWLYTYTYGGSHPNYKIIEGMVNDWFEKRRINI